MPSPETFEIRSGPFTARFMPAYGGRMSHLRHEICGDILVPMGDAPFEPLAWPRAGAYPLFPYHNRLSGAQFIHDGHRYTVDPNPALGADAMHGPAHRRPWRVTLHEPDRLDMVLEYTADADWPFDFRATQSFALTPEGLEITLSLVNTGAVPMPGGMGWHPYFQAGIEQAASTDAARAYLLDHQDVPLDIPPELRHTPEIPAQTGYTIHLTGWSRAGLEMTHGLDAILSADAAFPHLAVHRTAQYLCIEPVSHAAGSLALPQEDRAARGLVALAPGEAISGTIRLYIRGLSFHA